ncbi:hypothetical protein AJ80_04455 [Polytolypa hystricis UAMH7299]|uniref:Uncharacterized protein n=1 Tax=Polytolypa hystricis (strain UAMH7299) TaxID=1447883 RepID=A0A2B7YB50_POLH7|nr:hypothetical protein AJ80_04455 [Polytolypa hystricis UAMH7299]
MSGWQPQVNPWDGPVEAGEAPPLNINRHDPSWLLNLIFAAHPELHLDLVAMASVSERFPDPRVWSAVADLQQDLAPFQRSAQELRNMPTMEEEEEAREVQAGSSLAPIAEAVGPEGMGVWIDQNPPLQGRREPQTRQQRVQRAWEIFLASIHDTASNDDDSPLFTAVSSAGSAPFFTLTDHPDYIDIGSVWTSAAAGESLWGPESGEWRAEDEEGAVHSPDGNSSTRPSAASSSRRLQLARFEEEADD